MHVTSSYIHVTNRSYALHVYRCSGCAKLAKLLCVTCMYDDVTCMYDDVTCMYDDVTCMYTAAVSVQSWPSSYL